MSTPRKHSCLRPRALRVSQGIAVIPCGKCAECLKIRANELAVRVFREAQYRGNFFFLTLTYRDDMLPVQHNRFEVDVETGEYRFLSSERAIQFRAAQFRDCAPYKRVRNKKGVWCKRFQPYCYEVDGIYNELYQTLDNEDVKKAFKSFRRWYERTHDGCKLSDDHPFSYLVVPEYGGASYRPHYHLAFLGLPSHLVYEFARRWDSRFGHVDVERVRMSADDSDFSRVSSYLSKYASKGSFDCPFIAFGNCSKPHRLVSSGFGIGDPLDFDVRSDYWLCKDVYGSLDLRSSDVPVSPELFASRRHYTIGKFNYPFPRYFKKRVFGIKKIDYAKLFSDPDRYTHYRYVLRYDSVSKEVYADAVPVSMELPWKTVSSPLQKLVGFALLDNAARDLLYLSGLKCLVSSDSCDYRQGLRLHVLSSLDASTPTDPDFSADFPTFVDDFSVIDELSRSASIEADFRRSIADSFF